MRRNLILTSLFAIAIFVGGAVAQSNTGFEPGFHLKPLVYVSQGNGNGQVERAELWRLQDGQWAMVSPDYTRSAVHADAGKPLRLMITNNKRPVLSAGVMVYRVPCAGVPATSGGGAGNGVLTTSGTAGEYTWQTDPMWKGTCQMLVAKYSNGRHYGTRVRFD